MGEHFDCDVLVVGAGPTGLTLACELARRGVAVRVAEGAARPLAGSRGKGLQPRSLEVFDDLGVAGRLVATGRFRLPIRMYSGPDVVERDVSGGAGPSPDRPYARTLIIPQWQVEQALRDRLAESGVRVEYSTRLVSFAQHAHGVDAGLEQHGAPARLRARYLVGCDGGSSTVRRQLGIGFLGKTNEAVRMLVGDVRLDGLDRDYWHMWTHGYSFVALCPLPATDTFQYQASLAESEPEHPALERFQQLLDQHSGRTDIHLRDATWKSTWRLNVRMVDQYRSGRVFLAGDAAHVHSPAGGQGMNTGIQDACNLGWKLSHVLSGAPADLLDTYEQERLPVAASVLGLSSRLTHVGFRRRFAESPDITNATHQLGIHYRDSSLAWGKPSDDVLSAGDRAPDAPCQWRDGSPVRLFDLFRGPHLTVLAFGVRDAELGRRLADRYPGVLRAFTIVREADRADPASTVVDTGGHAHGAYGIEDSALVIVRPDGYLALREKEPAEAEILDYVSGIAIR